MQEGDNNVDINTKTVDGKNSYHVMARVIFQVQDENEASNSTDQVTRRNLTARRSLASQYKS